MFGDLVKFSQDASSANSTTCVYFDPSQTLSLWVFRRDLVPSYVIDSSNGYTQVLLMSNNNLVVVPKKFWQHSVVI